MLSSSVVSSTCMASLFYLKIFVFAQFKMSSTHPLTHSESYSAVLSHGLWLWLCILTLGPSGWFQEHIQSSVWVWKLLKARVGNPGKAKSRRHFENMQSIHLTVNMQRLTTARRRLLCDLLANFWPLSVIQLFVSPAEDSCQAQAELRQGVCGQDVRWRQVRRHKYNQLWNKDFIYWRLLKCEGGFQQIW